MAATEGIKSDGSDIQVGFETESDAENDVLDRIERVVNSNGDDRLDLLSFLRKK